MGIEFPVYVAFVGAFIFFVKDATLDSNWFTGVFSINLKNALPTITASISVETNLLTSSGVVIPKPIPTGISELTTFLVFFIAFMVYC